MSSARAHRQPASDALTNPIEQVGIGHAPEVAQISRRRPVGDDSLTFDLVIAALGEIAERS